MCIRDRLEGLSDKERECLLKLTGKVIDNCKAMGVDYRTIAVKGCRDRKPGHHHNHVSSNPLRYQQSAESGTASQRAWYPG